MSKPVIAFEHVSKFFSLYATSGIKELLLHFPAYIKERGKKRFCALNNLSFEIYKGETVGITGSNGAGKSTILALMAGAMKPNSGKIVANGRIAPLLELGAGFHPELTGRENIILNAIILGMTKKEAEGKMNDIIAFSELGEFIDQPIRMYSSGMMARLGFSVAVHIDPEILLVDEILAVGDTKFQEKCVNKMMSFKRMGVTIIFVTHSRDQIEKICERVIVIEKGRIQKIEKIGKKT